MEYVLPALVLGAALVLVALLFRRAMADAATRRDAASQQPLALLQNQLAAGLDQTARQVDALNRTLHETVQSLGGQVSRSLADSNRTVGERLDSNARLLGDVRQQLGQLEQSSRRMAEVGQDIARLQDILRPPKLRGALGELFLGELLAQVLPGDRYELQYRFRGGEAVDAVIRLNAGMVPIDAKFPLDNLRRILDAASDEERKSAKRAFVRDVKTHVDAIASKYIRTDEGTFDFALMYIPAENVYYETIVRDDDLGGEMALFAYSLARRVIPVSPNSFYAYLQTIVLGLRGLRVEEQAHVILQQLTRLRKEFDSFSETFRLVGQHLDNSMKKYTEAQARFGKIEGRFEQVSGMTEGLGAPEGGPVALPPVK
jgi:DNA recombination protein RmuC